MVMNGIPIRCHSWLGNPKKGHFSDTFWGNLIGEIFRQRCSCTGWLEIMDIQGIQKTWHPPNNIAYLASYMTFYPFATKHIYIYIILYI